MHGTGPDGFFFDDLTFQGPGSRTMISFRRVKKNSTQDKTCQQGDCNNRVLAFIEAYFCFHCFRFNDLFPHQVVDKGDGRILIGVRFYKLKLVCQKLLFHTQNFFKVLTVSLVGCLQNIQRLGCFGRLPLE
jgi:hypothetical protein